MEELYQVRCDCGQKNTISATAVREGEMPRCSNCKENLMTYDELATEVAKKQEEEREEEEYDLIDEIFKEALDNDIREPIQAPIASLEATIEPFEKTATKFAQMCFKRGKTDKDALFMELSFIIGVFSTMQVANAKSIRDLFKLPEKLMQSDLAIMKKSEEIAKLLAEISQAQVLQAQRLTELEDQVSRLKLAGTEVIH